MEFAECPGLSEHGRALANATFQDLQEQRPGGSEKTCRTIWRICRRSTHRRGLVSVPSVTRSTRRRKTPAACSRQASRALLPPTWLGQSQPVCNHE